MFQIPRQISRNKHSKDQEKGKKKQNGKKYHAPQVSECGRWTLLVDDVVDFVIEVLDQEECVPSPK